MSRVQEKRCLIARIVIIVVLPYQAGTFQISVLFTIVPASVIAMTLCPSGEKAFAKNVGSIETSGGQKLLGSLMPVSKTSQSIATHVTPRTAAQIFRRMNMAICVKCKFCLTKEGGLSRHVCTHDTYYKADPMTGEYRQVRPTSCYDYNKGGMCHWYSVKMFCIDCVHYHDYWPVAYFCAKTIEYKMDYVLGETIVSNPLPCHEVNQSGNCPLYQSEE